jgi:hypothetical protein
MVEYINLKGIDFIILLQITRPHENFDQLDIDMFADSVGNVFQSARCKRK